MGRMALAVFRSFGPMTRRVTVGLAIATIALLLVRQSPSGGGAAGSIASTLFRSSPLSGPYPARSDVREAKRVVEERGEGAVSFAVIGPEGGIRGSGERRQYSSASVSKALLLAAYLRSHKGRLDLGIESTLRSMITASDNDAAGTIYAIVGDDGLRAVARRAGMRDFEPVPGYWGGAQITAADMARFFYRLDRNLAGSHRRFGKRLLASIIAPQRWGIVAAAGKEWRIWFKGGWRPDGTEGTTGAVSHQAAQLRHKGGTRIAIAVLSTLPPGEGAGYSVIEEIARRLLNPSP